MYIQNYIYKNMKLSLTPSKAMSNSTLLSTLVNVFSLIAESLFTHLNIKESINFLTNFITSLLFLL